MMKHFGWCRVGVVGLVLFLAACPGPTPPAGDFSLRLEPNDPKLAPGGTVTGNVRITRSNGFNGPITLSLENAPAGVTATFDPNPATADTSAIALEAAKSLVAGNYAIQIKGVSGAASSTTSVSVAVAPVPPSTATVDTAVTPSVPNLEPLPDGVPRPVVAMTDTKGNKVDFALHELVIFSSDTNAVNALLSRWNGTLLKRTDPPKGNPHNLKSMFHVRVNTASADTSKLIADLGTLDPASRSDLKLSSQDALKLLSAAAREKTGGLEVSLNYLFDAQTFDDGASSESTTNSGMVGGSYSANVFDWPYMKRGGNQDIGVVDAWRALERSGKINASGASNGAIRLAVIDGGFFPGSNADFDLFTADGDELNKVNDATCGGNACPYHGTNVAMAAAARADNNTGGAGPAGPVARLMLYRKTALATGADAIWEAIDEDSRIINMSYGARFPAIVAWVGAAFDIVTASANAYDVLTFASAGNDGETVDGEDCFGGCWEEAFYSPCENAGVICVGGLANDSVDRHPSSNFGFEDVNIFGPFCMYVGSDPSTAAGVNRAGCGTSFASPFVAGVAALIWAANPNQSDDQVESILFSTAHKVTANVGGQTKVVRRYVNAFKAVSQALGNIPPRVVIDAPTNGSSFLYATDKTYKATTDDLDGSKPLVIWTSNVDGTLGTGSEITTHFTSPGQRTITASVTDDGGITRTASITVTGTNQNPSAQIFSPNTNTTFYVNDPVPFDGEGLDGNGAFAGPMPCSSLGWKSSKASDPNPLFTGCEKNNVVFTTTGTRTITLTATDPHGGTGTDTVTVNIVVKPPTGPPTVHISRPKEGAAFAASSKIRLDYTLSDPGGTPQSQYTVVWKLNTGSGGEKTITPKTCTVQVGGFPIIFTCFVPADYGISNNGVKPSTLTLSITDPEGLTGTDTVNILIGEVP